MLTARPFGPAASIENAAVLLERVRATRPRVHCITNTVAQAFTANVLLALGAIPSMTTSEDEIVAFCDAADALLVNLGTLDAERHRAIALAVAQISARQRPWVLDPVFIERSERRAALARHLVTLRPHVIRLNAAELAVLSADLAADAEVAAQTAALATAGQSCVALTGARDLVRDGDHALVVGNGDALMSRITAMGCAGSAVVAAMLSVADSAFAGATAGLIVMGVAGEIAAARAHGPGSFAVAFLDALYTLFPDVLTARAQVTLP